MSTIRIDDATFNDTDDHQFVWANRGDVEMKFPDGGTDEATIAVRLDVDGQIDIVYAVELHQSGDLAALERAIAAMQRVRDGLADLYGGRGHPGRCFEQGDAGRCRGQHGHDGDHRFTLSTLQEKAAS
jgi:hypothetical protein